MAECLMGDMAKVDRYDEIANEVMRNRMRYIRA